MKNIFQIIGLISLLFFSFFLTDKTASVIKNMDDIMITIKKNQDNYKIDGIDAIIKDDGIIPGISSRQVNINKSYQQMKEYGKYNEELYIYDYTIPNVSIENNKDKYIISGNPLKRMISLSFIVDNNTDITNIVSILRNKNIKASFFVTNDWLEDNLNLTYSLIEQGYDFGIDDENFNNFKWMNTIITKVGKQENIFCYYRDEESIKNCISVDGFSIQGIYIEDNYYRKVSDNLNSGLIISFKITSDLENNLNNIINYILKKGYTITTISDHIKE